MKCCATLQGFLRLPAILGAILPVLWMSLNAPVLFGSQHGGVRFSLATLFSLLILLRPKPEIENEAGLPRRPRPAWTVGIALAGTASVVLGLIIPIRLLEWIGILLLTYTCFAVALPTAYVRDLPLAMLVLFWANPLPNSLFTLLQTVMQTASVYGAECVLHLANTRVWADGMILRTGTRLFEVPEWCSGMRTATTVFILSLAIGILRRLRSQEILLFIAWSLVHALLLNVLRISAMIYFTPWMQGNSSLDFLHDTAGLIVIAGVFLVFIELLILEHTKHRRQQKRDMLQAARRGALSEYPPFWHRFLRRRRTAIIAIVLVSVTGMTLWRLRPIHRTRLLKDVATMMRDSGDPANAHRLALLIASKVPEDLDWRFTTTRMDLLAGHPQRVLEDLERLTDLPPSLQLQRLVLQAYALLHLGRLDEARIIADALPGSVRRTDPRLAMILAEMALSRDDAAAVASHITVASGLADHQSRIRSLYPYLRMHHQWAAMAATDAPVPYLDPLQAFSILEAQMNLDNTPRVAALTLEALSRWPDDSRLLEPLYFMAIRDRGDWESRFGTHLLRILPSIPSPVIIYKLFDKCFRLARPDLAWTLYHRIVQIDPEHPLLLMAAVEYGHRWFVFRRHHIGMPADSVTGTIDLKPNYRLGTILPDWEPYTRRIPLGMELSTRDTVPVRKAFLHKAIGIFSERDRQHSLTTDLQYIYAHALEISGRLDLARALLDTVVEREPGESASVRELYSEMLERKGAWMQVYETLRNLLLADAPTDAQSPASAWPPVPVARRADRGRLNLAPLLRLVNAQLELRLPLAAEFTVRETLRLYPYAPDAHALMARVLMLNGDDEDALHLLEKPRVRPRRELDALEAEALFATQRFNELDAFCRSRLLPQPRIPSGTVQDGSLPPAEDCLRRHPSCIPSEPDLTATAAALREHLESAGEGLRPLLTLWLDAWENRCEGDRANPSLWMETGRDRLEQATALSQLTLLLCRENRFADALPAARLAVAALPDSALLWQLLIGLEGGSPETIALARRFRPDDTDLWLADLVTRTQPGGSRPTSDDDRQRIRDNIRPLLDEALRPGSSMHTAGLARAADFLQRNGLYAESKQLAAVLVENARGLLPAYIITARNALQARDHKRAMASTTLAINASITPLPSLFENLVILKYANDEMDADSEMVNALRDLRHSDPRHPLWPQMLGYIRFRRGGKEILDAQFEMNTAIASGATNLTPYLIAAEVSRLLRNDDQAVRTLRRALEIHPGNLVVLNNLAYTLVQGGTNRTEALLLLPELIPAATKDPRVRDTVALVYLRNGNVERARETITRNLQNATPGAALWFRCQMHLAEIAWRQGNEQTAISMLEQILKSSRSIPDDDILAANTLLSRITTETPSTNAAVTITP
jgi:exosortase/archaeosortase family protein